MVKRASSKFNPPTSKTPRTDPTLPNSMQKKPGWHVGAVDTKGPWGWDKIQKDLFFTEILPKIKNFESMFWSEILNRNNHEVPVAQISHDAQERLIQLRLDDVESLVSLRLTGQQRIWGIRIDNILKILWWDPEHKVYPSNLKNT